MVTNELLKPGEVMDALRVSRSTLLRWVADGKITRVKLGDRTYRYRQCEVDALLAGEPVA